jgi:hypothetical protein
MNEKENIQKELKELAPHLPQQAPPPPFSVPNGYFEQLTETLTAKALQDSSGNIFRLWRQPWKQLVAAAIFTGIIFSSVYLYRQNISPDINKNPEVWVKKEINTVSDDKLNSFVTLASSLDSLSENSAVTALHQQEISSLTKDISDEEIQALLNEISQPGFTEENN